MTSRGSAPSTDPGAPSPYGIVYLLSPGREPRAREEKRRAEEASPQPAGAPEAARRSGRPGGERARVLTGRLPAPSGRRPAHGPARPQMSSLSSTIVCPENRTAAAGTAATGPLEAGTRLFFDVFLFLKRKFSY